VKELQSRLNEVQEAAEQMQTQLDALEARSIELEDEKLRLLAEMENARKRAQRRLEDERWIILGELMKPFLGVADDLERALQSANENRDAEGLIEGVRMVYAQLVDTFTKFGVEQIETVGKAFDYNLHEALGYAPAEGRDENEVVIEIAKGYLLDGKLLRASKVIIAKPEEETETDE
jgi:molecular chaperone GrpE